MRPLTCLLAILPALASATVRYTLSPDVASGTLRVSVTVEHAHPTETFQIPGWSPGYYSMAKYETKISGFVAADESGNPLPVKHAEPRTWSVTSNGRPALTVKYRVLADDPGLGFFGASIKSNSAFTNGPASFMYVLGRRNEDTRLRVTVPSGWQVATGMDKQANGDYTTHDYDEMADDPVQMGEFVDKPFSVNGVPFDAVFVCPPGEKLRMEADAQARVLKAISKPAMDLFGGASFHRYYYIFHLAPGGFQGGLEHRSGTVIAVPNFSQQDISDLAAHEFFHAWNVKQIRPVLLGPFDYTEPQKTGNLWFAEGVTDYYAKVLTYRSGVHDQTWLLEELSDQINTLQGCADRLNRSVEDASRAAWDNGGFSAADGLDYYNKGLVAGLIFDAAIRNATEGKKSLDDVMRLMYGRYKIPNPGYDEDGILKAINEVAGKDLSGLYTRVVRSTEEVPYDMVKELGLKLVKPGEQFASAEGWPVPTSNSDPADLEKDGFRKGDVFEGFDPSSETNVATVRVKRDGQDVSFSVPTHSQSVPGYMLIVDPHPSAGAAQQYVQWTRR